MAENALHKDSFPGQPPGFLGAAAVRVPGSCGELVQGLLEGGYFLISCPVDFFATVSVEIFAGEKFAGGPRVDAPESCPKTAAAVKATLAHLGREDLRVQVSVNNPIPRSKGLGSSSADVAAAIAATGMALGQELSPQDVARLALTVEPTDGVMFPGLALFDHREGRKMEVLGPPPPMELVALDFGGTVDTLEFNQADRRQAWESVALETKEALGLVRSGIVNCDPSLVGRGASISARSGQQVLPKPELPQVMDFAADVGAVGVNAARSFLTAQYPEWWPLILGGLFVGVVLLFPEGLFGLPRQLTRWWRRVRTRLSRRAGALPTSADQGSG